MTYLGDFHKGATVHHKFTTVNTTPVPATLAGSPVVSCYEDNSTTQTTAGITLTVDFDSVTGMHHIAVDTSNAAYSRLKDYQIVLTAGTVGGNSVAGYVLATFSIDNRMGSKGRSVSALGANIDDHSEAAVVLASLESEFTSSTNWRIYLPDGTTTLIDKTVTTDAGAVPIKKVA